MNIDRKYLILSAFSGAIVALDQLTKMYVHTQFRLGESINVINGFFNLTYVRNLGAAFGILAQSNESFRTTFFLLLPPIAMMLILFILKSTPLSERAQVFALSLVFGGALGNYIDRIRFGYVVDFLDFHIQHRYVWPAFNVADISIVVGVAILALSTVKQFMEVMKKQKTA